MVTLPKNAPLISVIMPVFNREAYLAEAIESILGQTHLNLELVVADDGSSDGSAPLIRAYALRDSRIRAFFWPHQGLPRTLNAAAPLARGDLVAYMDSDDIASPDRLEVQWRLLKEQELDVCGCQCQVFGCDNDLLGGKDGVTNIPQSHEAILRELLFSVPMIRVILLMPYGVCRDNPFNETIVHTDCEWPLRMALRYRMGATPEVLLKVRRHGKNITTTENNKFRLEMTRSHFQFFFALYPRASLADYISLCRVVDQVPLTSIEELEMAGRWMARLAVCAEDAFGRRMAKRWLAACERSSGLGEEVNSVCKRYLEVIEKGGDS